MNGHFEVEQNAYPIGYISNGTDYFVTDMRSLNRLSDQKLTSNEAAQAAAAVNAKLRSGNIQSAEALDAAVDVAIAGVLGK